MKTQTFRVYDPSSVYAVDVLTRLDGRAHVEKLCVHCLNVAEVYV